MTDRELMQQALDALVHTNAEWKSLADSGDAGFWKAENQDYYVQCKIAIEALRARLSQCDRCGEVNPAEIHTCTPKQEPVAWMHIQGNHEDPCFRELTEDEISRGWTQKPLYTAPPQRDDAPAKAVEWQGLTDEDRQEIERWIEFKEAGGNEPVPVQKLITYIEAKLREKNSA